MKSCAILLLHCPDKPGIISEVTKFVTDNKGNIVYLDQYVDREDGMFFMRIEWELEKFLIPREKLYDYIDTLYALRYKNMWNTKLLPINPAPPVTIIVILILLFFLICNYSVPFANLPDFEQISFT